MISEFFVFLMSPVTGCFCGWEPTLQSQILLGAMAEEAISGERHSRLSHDKKCRKIRKTDDSMMEKMILVSPHREIS